MCRLDEGHGDAGRRSPGGTRVLLPGFTKPREGEVRGFARKVKYSELITSDACGENILRLSGKEYELIKDKTNFDNDDLATLNL